MTKIRKIEEVQNIIDNCSDLINGERKTFPLARDIDTDCFIKLSGLIHNKNNNPSDKHDQKLSHCNRSKDFIFYFNKLWHDKLLHTIT